ncbi:hypothetical protein Ahy_A07g033600 isoform C [Arachis hypogaea]|uniref:GrpE protein homolog n=1 Tax=Arachis hypogaea TaxID=3818 RepID=A0A445C9N7_ARAHY|nr:hypothetical protein Ahy_A07g033600 isoform C [Arachis hypogaea]
MKSVFVEISFTSDANGGSSCLGILAEITFSGMKSYSLNNKDSSLHEAVAREESQEFKEGIIIKETRRGFFLGDRVLRPALVKVSSGPGNKKSMVASDKSLEQPSAAAGVDER